MQAGIAMACDKNYNVIHARLMGGPNQCLVLQMPLPTIDEAYVWCVLPYPHEGDHDYSGGPGARKS